MDNLIDFFDNFAKSNGALFKGHPHGKWKYCVALTKRGWEAYRFETTDTEDNDNIIIYWHKDGEEDIVFSLSFTDQQMWIDYMQRGQKNVK
jgi:hypothetical protein